VVGLGASGLTAAQLLAERGLSVVGLDAGRVAAGAAGRNGGFLLGGAAPFLHDALAQWGEPAVELYRATLAELDRLADWFGPEVVRRAGSIRLAGLPGAATTEAEQAQRDAELVDCSAHEAALRRYGIAVERYEGRLGVGLFLPDDAAANPARLAVAAALALPDTVRLCERSVVTSLADGVVRTACGSVTADVVIVAVDGGLEVLLPQLAGRVRTARLQMLSTSAAQPVLPCPVYCRWGYDYAQQVATGEIFVGGGRDRFEAQEWTCDTEPTPDVQSYLDGLLLRFAPDRPAVLARWGASVGFTEDRRPLCAALGDGVVAVGGYSGTGNLVGRLAARAAVALALDGTSPPDCFAS
jgi:glycine/D-amino acid oxidase-like deaminating enzyme